MCYKRIAFLSMSALTVAVTGANSYIGQHLVARISSLCLAVRALDRGRFDLIRGLAAPALEGVDVVIQGAGERPRETRRRYTRPA